MEIAARDSGRQSGRWPGGVAEARRCCLQRDGGEAAGQGGGRKEATPTRGRPSRPSERDTGQHDGAAVTQLLRTNDKSPFPEP